MVYRCVAKVNVAEGEAKVKHYSGLGPEFAAQVGSSPGVLMPNADFIVMKESDNGFRIERYTNGGGFCGDTWHPSIEEAKDQAKYEYEDGLGDWIDVPDGVEDIKTFLEER